MKESVALYFRKSSTIYYLLQFILISTFTRILNIDNNAVVFFATLACVAIASEAVIRYSGRYPLLKKLY